MNVIITKRELARLLSGVRSVVPRGNSPHDYADLVWLSAAADTLAVTASGDCTITVRGQASVYKVGGAALSYRRLQDAVRRATAGQIRLAGDRLGDCVQIDQQDWGIDAPRQDVTPPTIAAMDETTIPIQVDSGDFRRAVAAAAGAVDRHGVRPILGGVQMELLPAALRFVGGDGFHLAVAEIEHGCPASADAVDAMPVPERPMPGTVPARVLESAAQLAKHGDAVEVALDGEHVRLVVYRKGQQRARIVCPLLPGVYPGWHEIPDQARVLIATFYPGEMLSALERAASAVRKGQGQPAAIELRFAASTITLSAETSTTSFQAVVPAQTMLHRAPAFSVRIDARFLIAALSNTACHRAAFWASPDPNDWGTTVAVHPHEGPHHIRYFISIIRPRRQEG